MGGVLEGLATEVDACMRSLVTHRQPRRRSIAQTMMPASRSRGVQEKVGVKCDAVDDGPSGAARSLLLEDVTDAVTANVVV